MDLYTHRNLDGKTLFHLIHHSYKDNHGTMRKRLISSIPTELLKLSNENVFNLFRLESKRIETTDKIDFYEALATSLESNPLSEQFYYPASILSADGSLTPERLLELENYIEDLDLKPGDFMSEQHNQMKHFILNSKFFRYRDYFKNDYIRDVKIITRGRFEEGMKSIEMWQQYSQFNGKKGLCYLTTKTMRGYDLNILFDKKPLMEYVQ